MLYYDKICIRIRSYREYRSQEQKNVSFGYQYMTIKLWHLSQEKVTIAYDKLVCNTRTRNRYDKIKAHK